MQVRREWKCVWKRVVSLRKEKSDKKGGNTKNWTSEEETQTGKNNLLYQSSHVACSSKLRNYYCVETNYASRLESLPWISVRMSRNY